jgi:hypothetical protein
MPSHRCGHGIKWPGATTGKISLRFVHASRTPTACGRFTVFNIGGNKCRLVTVIHHNRGKVFVRHVLTHKEDVTLCRRRTGARSGPVRPQRATTRNGALWQNDDKLGVFRGYPPQRAKWRIGTLCPESREITPVLRFSRSYGALWTPRGQERQGSTVERSASESHALARAWA